MLFLVACVLVPPVLLECVLVLASGRSFHVVNCVVGASILLGKLAGVSLAATHDR
jgi:hypothetical protein